MSAPECWPEKQRLPERASFSCVLSHSSHGAAWLRLTGELALDTFSHLAQRLDDAFTSARLVVLDLRQLTFMDSAGLAVIEIADDRARRSERRLVLIRGPRQIDHMLELAGLSDRFEITDLESIRTPRSRSVDVAPNAV